MEGKALERALSQGRIDEDGYRWRVRLVEERLGLRQPLRASEHHRNEVGEVLPDGVTPLDVVLAIGPGTTRSGNARYAARISLALGVPMTLLLVYLRRQNYYLANPIQNGSVVVPEVAYAAWEMAQWAFTGIVLGLLWQNIPGRRGPLKSLWLAPPMMAVPLLQTFLAKISGDSWDSSILINCVLYAALLTMIGLVMDFLALRSVSSVWASSRTILLAAYGLSNPAAQITVVLTQIGGLIALYNAITGKGGDMPSTGTGGGSGTVGR